MQFSANLGFLWTERPLTEAIARAAARGFPAVELHWPYETPAAELATALKRAAIPLLGLNTPVGNRAAGDFGLLAVPGREDEARRGMKQAIDYAVATGARFVHAMAGKAAGAEAGEIFVAALRQGAREAARHGIALLIEPINSRDVPGYYLSDLEAAAGIVEKVGAENLGLMFDCYHMQIMGGDLITRFRAHRRMILHVQIAAVPDRGEPDSGEVDYRWLLNRMMDEGYDGWFGAEYRPRTDTDAGLGWMDRLVQR